MRLLLAFCCIAEGTMGLLLLAWPSVVLQLLFGSPASGPADPIGRIAGIALISLGIACFPRRDSISLAPVLGMLIYNLLVAIYLTIVGIGVSSVGVLLWPAALLHAGVTLGLVVLRSNASSQK